MGWLIIVLILLIVLLAWLLLSPLVLRIDTERNVYRLTWSFGFLRADARGEPDDIRLRLKVAFWHKSWTLIDGLLRKTSSRRENDSPEPSPSGNSPKSPKKRKRRKRKISPRRIFSLVRAAGRSFRVRECTLHLDTDDFVWNAWLFPLFYFLRSERRDLQINFEGHSLLRLEISNSLGRLGWFVLKKWIFSPKNLTS